MNELEFNSNEVPFPTLDESSSTKVDLELIQTMLAIEPLVYILSALLFVIFSIILVVKTKAAGRFLLILGPCIVVVFGLYQYFSNPTFPLLSHDSPLFQISLTKMVLAVALTVSTIGFCRLVWWVKKQPMSSCNKPLLSEHYE